jgi:predicted neuraminidase
MTVIRAAVLLLVLAGFALALTSPGTSRIPALVLPDTALPAPQNEPQVIPEFISGDHTLEVHSATAVELSNGDIRVFWYGGTREGSKDTAIYTRVLDAAQQVWSDIDIIMTRQKVAADTRRNIRKLGNPVAIANGNEIRLFFVSTSIGGWATSSINLSVSGDNGKTWGAVSRLISSPLINISTLVRNPPLLAENGELLLPVYHELAGKFSELLQLDTSGSVINKFRISDGIRAIQPLLLPVDSTHAVALMRNGSDKQPRKILSSRSMDKISDWAALEELSLPNPDAAITAVQLDKPDELLMVFNNHASERDDITMAYRRTGTSKWQVIHRFEAIEGGGGEHNPFSYPFLVKTRDGNFHLFYTWKRKKIKHVYFNRAALQHMLSAAGPST